MHKEVRRMKLTTVAFIGNRTVFRTVNLTIAQPGFRQAIKLGGPRACGAGESIVITVCRHKVNYTWAHTWVYDQAARSPLSEIAALTS